MIKYLSNFMGFIMESFVDELKIQKVLSKEDIITLKNYIGKKYAHLSSSKRSDILAHAVYQIIGKNTEGLENVYNSEARCNLLKNTILKDGQPILLIDIFNICISIKDKPQNFTQELTKWINLHVENKISKTELEMYDNCDNDISLDIRKSKNKDIFKAVKLRYIVCILIAGIIFQNTFFLKRYHALHQNNIITGSLISSSVTAKENRNTGSGIPDYFRYKEINKVRLKTYLNARNSLIAEEPYFSTIIDTAKRCNINPLVFFAITGAEQGFVPKDDSCSKKIANNPFNVYHSWKEYNTNIKDSSTIAGVTIINLCKDRPQGKEPFKWINRKYAENPNWGKVVKELYEELEENDGGVD